MHDLRSWKVCRRNLYRWLQALEGKCESLAHPVVRDRKNIGPAQSEDQEHLDRPTTDAANLREVFDDVLVGHAADPRQRRYGSIHGLGGQIAQGQHFIVREAGGAKLLVGAIEQVLRGGMNSDSADVVEALQHTFVDRRRGLAMKLLIDDRFDERFEGRLRTGEAQRKGAGSSDQAAQLWIGCGELRGRSIGVVLGSTGTRDASSHEHDRSREWRAASTTTAMFAIRHREDGLH